VYWVQLVIAGVAVGFIYALAGMGVVLTYKATGVFNFGHGAVAVFVAYVYWQLTEWGLTAIPAAFLAILVVGPLLGLLLEWSVFRPLQRSGASTVEKLVATLGVFVLFLGVVYTLWTGEVRQVVPVFSPRPLQLADGLIVGIDQIGVVVTVVLVCAGLWALFRFTHLGTEIRAVVDRRELAELASVDADRVAAIAWALSIGMAGMAGVLFAASSRTLNPYDLTLFMIETLSLAVVARLTSLPIAVGTGVLLLGVGDTLLKTVEIAGGEGVLGQGFNQLKPNVSVLLLFGALLVYRRLDVVGEETGRRLPFVRAGSGRGAGPVAVVTAVVLAALPFALDRVRFDYAHQMLALVVVFASIVVITGFSGHISLGQAAFAGLGAFVSARVANSFGLPVVFAMVVGGLVTVAAGFLAGYPALRRRGLFLALTTLALGLLISRFVLENTAFAGGTNGLQVRRPSVFGFSLDGDFAFYYFELVVVGLVPLLARNLRSGRLGRALAAMRDSEAGARSIGIDLRAYKLFIFGASAFMAGIGGALLTQQARQFTAVQQFNPFNSLFWFAAVVVAGVGSIFGAVLAAAIFVMLGAFLPVSGSSQALIGLAALMLGRLPGASLLGLASALTTRVRLSVQRAFEEGRRPPPEPVVHRPSPLAVQLLGTEPSAPAPSAAATAAAASTAVRTPVAAGGNGSRGQ
jgi:branched-chain amino acid transport system permease protein